MSFTAVVSGETAITARGPLKEAAERVLGRLWIDEIPVRLASEDASLWPSSAAAAAAGRPLCGPAQPGPGRAALDRAGQLCADARAAGLTEVALLGRGAPARAAELIADAHQAAAGRPGHRPLSVLDGLDPGPVLRILDDPARLDRTVIVVAGDDPGTETLRRVFDAALRERGLSPADAARRFVTVAEPGTAAAEHAVKAGHPLVEAPAATPFGALSPYALVPAALAGADVAALLRDATAVLPALTRPEDNPGLVLGAILGGAARAGRPTAVLGGYPAAFPGIARWAARLLDDTARGRLVPVVQDGGLPLLPDDDLFLVTFGGRPHQDDATIRGPLAAQLAVWEYAAAVACHLLDVDPLAAADRPAPMTVDDGSGEPLFADGDRAGAVEAHTTVPGLARATGVAELLDVLTGGVGPGGHLTLVAYLDPDESFGQGAQVRRLAALLAARSGRPVKVCWDTRPAAGGNDHSGGGVHLLVTGNVVRDVPVPGRHHRLGMLQLARALGDARATRAAGRAVVRLHLRNRPAGLARLLESARQDR